MYSSSVQRRLNKHATTVMLGGIFLFFSVVLYLGLCSMPCEVQDEAQMERSFDDVDQPFWNRKSNLRKRKESSFLVVALMTGPKYFERRKTIRQTWLSQVHPDVKHYFVIGTSGLSLEERGTLEYENSQHHDLLLLPELKDSYYNLTTKVLHTAVWLTQNLSFQFLFKGDDDTFVRVDKMLEELRLHDPERLYWGFFDGRAKVHKTGQWAEKNWVLCDNYLPHARGGGYVLSVDLVQYLARNAKLFQKYNSEDISMGVWLAPLDIERKHDVRFDTEYKSRGCHNAYIVTHKQDVYQMRDKHLSLLESGNLCKKEFRVRYSYEYNWKVAPTYCCIRNDTHLP